jgi:hypothetical protein
MCGINTEKKTVAFMIRFYYKRHHPLKDKAPECLELIAYAHKKLDLCRYGNKKPACSKCTTHCYSAEKRKMIKTVMRYSGPRMILVRPHYAIMHLFAR